MDADETIVRVLILASRYPWPPYSGDRLRTTMWVDALADSADVTLVIPNGAQPPLTSPGFRVVHPRRSFPPLWTVVYRKLPLHTLMAATHAWAGAIPGAERFDAALVILSRLDPWVGKLPAPFTILDAIDSLAHSMEEREREASSALARSFWRHEARAMKCLERDVATRYDRVLVVSEAEASWFGSRAEVVPIGVPIYRYDPDRPRRYDFGFWGRLAYFANDDAAVHLVSDLWPRIRQTLPGATLVIAGANAPQHLRRNHGRNGITVISPVVDISALARDVRVALFPIRFGTGQLTKVLEAAEAGCAIVGTSRAMCGLDVLRPHAMIADGLDEFVRAATDLAGSSRGRDLAAGVRSAVERHFSREAMKQKLVSIVREGTV